MAISQQRLAADSRELIGRLLNPACVGQDGSRSQPSSPDDACPEGSQRLHAPVRDLNVGVITSSLGDAGLGTVCTAAAGKDDRAHLVPTFKPGLPTPGDRGVFEYRAGDDPSKLQAEVQAALFAVGEAGCGFEMPLEAMYRFLVQPEPYAELVRAPCNTNDTTNGCVVQAGVDQELLDQRAAFLRPGSTIAIVSLGNENDCSTPGGGQYHLGFDFENFRAAPTRTCETDPNSACCYSCLQAQVGSCPTKASECSAGDSEASPNLRCWDQKRRMGIDFLFPVERYQAGLRGKTLFTAPTSEESGPNPLFEGNLRGPNQVHFLTISGVPASHVLDPEANEQRYLTASALEGLGRWGQLVGDPQTYLPPSDPFMVESTTVRQGVSSISGLSPAQTNPTNGGDVAAGPQSQQLQYACIGPLAQPFPCGSNGCLCQSSPDLPICEGTDQIAVEAYPSIRQLEVARRVDGSVASICQWGTTPGQVQTGFGAAFESLQRALGDSVR